MLSRLGEYSLGAGPTKSAIAQHSLHTKENTQLGLLTYIYYT